MDNVIMVEQVHGNNVVIVSSKDIGTTIPNYDALITNDARVTLCVRVADCLPISVISEKGHAIGLIHAGWRGLENGVIGKTFALMCDEFRINSKQSLLEYHEELIIKIGPHICARHYEVKSDVLSKFSKYPEAVLNDGNKIFLDLAKIAELQLLELGVKKENIKIDQRCTFEDNGLFSYRRDKTTDRNIFSISGVE